MKVGPVVTYEFVVCENYEHPPIKVCINTHLLTLVALQTVLSTRHINALIVRCIDAICQDTYPVALHADGLGKAYAEVYKN